LARRRQPRQQRARVTVEAILEAAADLFATRGYVRTTTNDIAAHSGVAIGSLYQYFPNKDSILASLVERHRADVGAVIEDSLATLADDGVTFRRGIARLLEQLLAVHDANPTLSRAVEEHTAQVPRLPRSLTDYESVHLVELERILRTRPDVRRGDYALMAQILFQMAEVVSAWLAHGTGQADRGEATAEAVEALCRFVER
jgi:AcrR family transcriptional regulator